MLKVALPESNVLTVIFPSTNEQLLPDWPTIPPHEKPIDILAPLVHVPDVCFNVM